MAGICHLATNPGHDARTCPTCVASRQLGDGQHLKFSIGLADHASRIAAGTFLTDSAYAAEAAYQRSVAALNDSRDARNRRLADAWKGDTAYSDRTPPVPLTSADLAASRAARKQRLADAHLDTEASRKEHADEHYNGWRR